MMYIVNLLNLYVIQMVLLLGVFFIIETPIFISYRFLAKKKNKKLFNMVYCRSFIIGLSNNKSSNRKYVWL